MRSWKKLLKIKSSYFNKRNGAAIKRCPFMRLAGQKLTETGAKYQATTPYTDP